MSKEMIIGKKYNAPIGETIEGNVELEKLTLEKIEFHKGKEIYIFSDILGGKIFDYKRSSGERVDWNFVNEISEKFEI